MRGSVSSGCDAARLLETRARTPGAAGTVGEGTEAGAEVGVCGPCCCSATPWPWYAPEPGPSHGLVIGSRKSSPGEGRAFDCWKAMFAGALLVPCTWGDENWERACT